MGSPMTIAKVLVLIMRQVIHDVRRSERGRIIILYLCFTIMFLVLFGGTGDQVDFLVALISVLPMIVVGLYVFFWPTSFHHEDGTLITSVQASAGSREAMRTFGVACVAGQIGIIFPLGTWIGTLALAIAAWSLFDALVIYYRRMTYQYGEIAAEAHEMAEFLLEASKNSSLGSTASAERSVHGAAN
jgi:hypothetical protein